MEVKDFNLKELDSQLLSSFDDNDVNFTIPNDAIIINKKQLDEFNNKKVNPENINQVIEIFDYFMIVNNVEEFIVSYHEESDKEYKLKDIHQDKINKKTINILNNPNFKKDLKFGNFIIENNLLSWFKYTKKTNFNWTKSHLDYALWKGSIECIKCLYENNCVNSYWELEDLNRESDVKSYYILKYFLRKNLVNKKKIKEIIIKYHKALLICSALLNCKLKITEDILFWNNADLNYIKLLHENGYSVSREEYIYAVKISNLEIFKFIHELYLKTHSSKILKDTNIFNTAIKYNSNELINYLIDNGFYWDNYTFSEAVQNNNLELFIRLHKLSISYPERANSDKESNFWKNKCYEYAINNKNYEIFEYLISHNNKFNTYRCIQICIENNDFETINYLYKLKFEIKIRDNLLNDCINKNNLPILQSIFKIYELDDIECQNIEVSKVINNNNLDMLAFLNENNLLKNEHFYSYIKKCIKINNFNILKFLFEILKNENFNLKDIQITDIYDCIRNNNLDMIKFLHENATLVFCSKYIDKCIESNLLDIASFLLKIKDCNEDIFKFYDRVLKCIEKENLTFLKLICNNSNKSIIEHDMIFYNFYDCNNFELMQYLYDYISFEKEVKLDDDYIYFNEVKYLWNSDLMLVALKGKNVEFFKFLIQNGCRYNNDIILNLILKCNNKFFGIFCEYYSEFTINNNILYYAFPKKEREKHAIYIGGDFLLPKRASCPLHISELSNINPESIVFFVDKKYLISKYTLYYFLFLNISGYETQIDMLLNEDEIRLSGSICKDVSRFFTYDKLKYVHQKGCPLSTVIFRNVCLRIEELRMETAFESTYLENKRIEIAKLNYLIENNVELNANELISGELQQIAIKINADLEDMICTYLASLGLLNCLKYARSMNYKWSNMTCFLAAKFGHNDCLEYAYQNGCECDDRVIKIATKYNNLKCLEILEDKNSKNLTKNKVKDK